VPVYTHNKLLFSINDLPLLKTTRQSLAVGKKRVLKKEGYYSLTDATF
jgi:hypothetical protein